jgi:hypothetical protein
MITNLGSGAGISVDTHGDLLCFGTWSPGRYESGYNLWAYRGLDGPSPVRVGAAGTLDWIYQLTCRDSGSEQGWAYVADEWGGLELWASDGAALTLDLENHRIPSGALSLDIFTQGQRVYSAKEGAGLWYFDEATPEQPAIAVEWIDRSDPGCACQDCCPPEQGAWPYPPAIFIDKGLVNQGRIFLLGHDRNTAVPGDSYFMTFNESGDEYELIYSNPLIPSDPFAAMWGANMLSDNGEIIFAALATGDLQLYQHCPGQLPEIRPLGAIATPSSESGLEFGDAAVYGDYLFLAERHRFILSEPDRGLVHVFRWKSGDLVTCPAQPELLNPPEYLGAFGEGMIPYRLLVDLTQDRLYIGFTSKRTWPIIEGGIYAYDLAAFDPGNVAAMDTQRTNLTAPASMRVTYANVHEFLLLGDELLITDYDNGLYRYDLSQGRYTGFYPAHRGPNSEAYMPRELVQSPEGVVPLYHPLALVQMPSGGVAVQEHVTGRVSIFSIEEWVYLPTVWR